MKKIIVILFVIVLAIGGASCSKKADEARLLSEFNKNLQEMCTWRAKCPDGSSVEECKNSHLMVMDLVKKSDAAPSECQKYTTMLNSLSLQCDVELFNKYGMDYCGRSTNPSYIQEQYNCTVKYGRRDIERKSGTCVMKSHR